MNSDEGGGNDRASSRQSTSKLGARSLSLNMAFNRHLLAAGHVPQQCELYIGAGEIMDETCANGQRHGVRVGQSNVSGFKDWPRRGIVRGVIRSFKDRRTRRFYEGHPCRGLQVFADQAVRRLTLLASAKSLGDLAALASNRLESLRGDRAGQYSIRINAQWRVCFRWSVHGPYDVEIVDYHR